MRGWGGIAQPLFYARGVREFREGYLSAALPRTLLSPYIRVSSKVLQYIKVKRSSAKAGLPKSQIDLLEPSGCCFVSAALRNKGG